LPHICKACHDAGPHKNHTLREMMFGTREEFAYIECRNCGTIQRASDVLDEGKFYPEGYYSFAGKTKKTLRSKIGEHRDRDQLLDDTILGRFLNRFRPRKIDPQIEILRRLKLNKTASILDVGCGSGALLHRLAGAGLENLTGADPFIAADISIGGVNILKSDIQSLAGKFDVIMFHHSFEHMPDPEKTLMQVRQHLAPDGKCLIRIPTCSSAAWLEYGKNWVQLDAPRHVVVFSRGGFATLANRSGFSVIDMLDDSNSFQFWGSEMYRKNIPLRSKQPEEIFSPAELSEFERRSDDLNSRNEGDQTAFIISLK
jgi:SAM-dependent methyltransferase